MERNAVPDQLSPLALHMEKGKEVYGKMCSILYTMQFIQVKCTFTLIQNKLNNFIYILHQLLNNKAHPNLTANIILETVTTITCTCMNIKHYIQYYENVRSHVFVWINNLANLDCSGNGQCCLKAV